VYSVSRNDSEFRAEYDGHDYAIDGNNFAKDDGDQILGSDSRGFDTTTEDGRTGNEDSPVQIERLVRGRGRGECWVKELYHAAPTTDNPIHNPTPISAHAYGDISSRNWPTC
jgi:hypothetical protein